MIGTIAKEDASTKAIGVYFCCMVEYKGSIKDENIGNHRYIGNSILRIYRIYRRYFGYIGNISADIIGRIKIVKNSWKCKKNLIII